MFYFISSDGTFSAVWSPWDQRYTIYKDDKFFMFKYKFDAVKPYLGESYGTYR